MKPTQFIAGIVAASFFAAPLAGVANAAPATRAVQTSSAHRGALMPFVGYARPTQTVSFLVHLPLRNKDQAVALSRQLSSPKSALFRHWLTPAQFAARFGPTRADMQAAVAALRAGGLSIGKVDAQFIHASAPASTVERFFGTRLGLVRDGTVQHIDARTPVTVPAALARINASIIGLRGVPRPVADHVVVRKGVSLPRRVKSTRTPRPQAFFGPYGPYFPGELLQAYSLPSYTFGNGAGEHIGIVGLSDSVDADNQTNWCYYGLGPDCFNGSPYPTVNHYETVGSIPPNTDGNSLEAALDAQMAGGSAPGAVIDQYAADAYSNFGFLDMFSYIVNTNVDDVITTSYSSCELYYTGYYSTVQVPFYYLIAYDDTFLQGSIQGQSFLFSSGDNGGLPCLEAAGVDGTGPPPYNFVPSVSAFAADPNVTGVGGTTIFNTQFTDGGFGTLYNYESSPSYTYPPDGFYNNYTYGSGGGVSTVWGTPNYQAAIGLSGGRQVPDVAMHMGGLQAQLASSDWVYSYQLLGGWGTVIGTSASAPEFAGWVAEFLSAYGVAAGNPGNWRFGNLNDFLYSAQISSGPGAFNQYLYASNGVTTYCGYCGTPGYNQITGLGTPNAQGIWGLTGFDPFPTAGDTYTASNP